MTSPARAPRPAHRRDARPVEPVARRRDHLRVVERPPQGRRSLRSVLRVPVLVLITAAVFGSLLASAFFHAQLVGGQDQLDHLNEQLEQERVELAREKLVLAELSSPQHIASEAAALGMVVADGQTWLSPGSGAGPVVTGGGADDPTSVDDATTSELAAGPTETEAP